jgi:hypothetical protein
MTARDHALDLSGVLYVPPEPASDNYDLTDENLE